MANFLDKLKIKTAVENSTKLDLGCTHITTANFMQFNVAWCKELVPKEKISVNMETFTRLQPMPVPTFGRARINNRAFFVPFRTVFEGWNDFITDTVNTVGDEVMIQAQVPMISNMIFVQMLLAEGLGYATEVTGEADYKIFDGNSQYRYVKLTAKGRQFVKVLESLGYKIIPNLADETVYSALPLLCLAKVYMDWYYPSAYIQNSDSTFVNGLFNNPVGTLGVSDVNIIYNVIGNVCYDSDYFVSAWDNPTAPNTGAYSDVNIVGPNGEVIATDAGNGTPSLGSRITQYGIDVLKSLTDYMKRHQIVGARALDRYLARFGVNLTAEKLRRSVYIGSGSENIQFGDVMSTADTDGSALGNYAGKGLGYGASNFDYETDEYGMMIIVSSIVPKAGYYQGVNRNVTHIYKTDFWTPEFDNVGTQAISAAELFVPQDGENFDLSTTNYYFDNQIFGWTPRYAEYKVGRDMLTGDFRYNSINSGAEAWHTMREVEYTDLSDIVHNVNFVAGNDASQYSRIFYNTDADAADKFNVIYNFEIASWSPMKSLFDTYEFDSKGNSVIEDVNGVKMN